MARRCAPENQPRLRSIMRMRIGRVAGWRIPKSANDGLMMMMAGSSLATNDIDLCKERGSATGSLLLLMFSLQTALFPLRYAISLICFFLLSGVATPKLLLCLGTPPEICMSTQNCKISESQIGQGENERTRKEQMSRNFEISICVLSVFLFWPL